MTTCYTPRKPVGSYYYGGNQVILCGADTDFFLHLYLSKTQMLGSLLGIPSALQGTTAWTLGSSAIVLGVEGDAETWLNSPSRTTIVTNGS